MESVLFLLAGIFGLLLGSFLNVLIYRLPKNLNIAYPGSGCTNCGKAITWYENIPIFSYLFLKGKCSQCRAKISLLYPFIEFVTMGFAFIIAPKSINSSDLVNYFFFLSVFCVFLVHFVVDLKHQILPDSLNLYLACIFLLVSFFSHPWQYWTLGGLIGFGFPLTVSLIFYKLKGQVGLGGGDIKLYGALGLYLGPIGIIQNIFLSCTLGAVVGLLMIAVKIMKRENPIPFGPFIIFIAFFQIFTESFYQRIVGHLFP